MFHDYEAVVTVDAGGRLKLTLPDADPGIRVRIAVRKPDDSWAARLGAAFAARAFPTRLCDAGASTRTTRLARVGGSGLVRRRKARA